MPVRLVWSWMMAATSPELPMNLAMWSAAAPAAAMLSVAAVATGMSESTPESKPTTGILAACAFCSKRNGCLGVECGEADGGRLLLASSACSISICLSTWDFVLRTFEIDLDLVILGSLLEPILTACQKLVLEALGDDGDVRFGARAAGALTSATAARRLTANRELGLVHWSLVSSRVVLARHRGEAKAA